MTKPDIIELLHQTPATPETARRLQDAAIREIEQLRKRVGVEQNEARGEAAVQKRIERATQPLLDEIDGLRAQIEEERMAAQVAAEHHD